MSFSGLGADYMARKMAAAKPARLPVKARVSVMRRLCALVVGFLAISLAVPSWAAFGTPYSLGNAVGSSAANFNVVFTVQTAAASGDLVVVQVHWDKTSGNIMALADSAGACSAWSGLTQLNGVSGAGRIRTFYCKLTGNLPVSATITATLDVSSGNFRSIFAAGVSGTGVVDKALTGNSNTNTSATTAIGTLSSPDQIIFASFMAAPATSSLGGYTLAAGYNDATTSPHELIYKVVSTTTPGDPTVTLGSSGAWIMQALSFTDADAPPVATFNGRSLLGVGK